MNILYVPIFASLCIRIKGTDVFASTYELQRLVDTESDLIAAMKIYLKSDKTMARSQHKKLLEFIKEAETNITSRMGHVKESTSHPGSAYKIIKRFSTTWGNELKSQEQRTKRDLSAILNHLRIQFPDKTDVEAVAKAILRLQKLYHIHPRNFASWRNISVLSVTESFDLAKFALKYNESRLALGWVNQILDMKANGKSNDKSNDAIYRFAAKAYEKLSKIDLCMNCGQKDKSDDMDGTRSLPVPVQTAGAASGGYNTSKFDELCRYFMLSSTHMPLQRGRCDYWKGNVPYKRWKREWLHRDPDIALYYDVISEKEATHVKILASQMLTRATVGNPQKQKSNDARISKLAWLWDNHTRTIHKLSSRVSEITGLSTKYRDQAAFAEPFQVLNYGVGGRYLPHYDFYTDRRFLANTASFIRDSGGRLVTFLIYFGDVSSGGATVFPEIGIGVPPIKYSGVLWYNYNKDGEPDYRTKHGGCPVYIGDKWVANKWIHEISGARECTRR